MRGVMKRPRHVPNLEPSDAAMAESARRWPGAGRQGRRTNALALMWLEARDGGDAAAGAIRQELWLSVQGMVVDMARALRTGGGRSFTLDDLIGHGQVGVAKALDHYDPARGGFTTCAGVWVSQSIREAFRSSGAWLVHVPHHAAVAARGGATYRPVADDYVAAARRAMVVVGGLGQPSPSGKLLGADRRAPGTGPAEEALDRLAREESARGILATVDRLPPRHRQVFLWITGLEGEPPLTYAEAARRLGVCRERARQMFVRAATDVLRMLANRPGVRPGLSHVDLAAAVA